MRPVMVAALAAVCLRAEAAEVEAMVNLDHNSNLIRGCPRRCDQSEPTQDYLGGGVTITAGKKRAWEIDLSHGIKWVDRGRRQVGSDLSVRFYPGRLRR